MVLQKIFVFILFLFALNSSAKKKNNPSIPQYMREFNEHFSNQDIDGLIKDYSQYPQLRKRIASYLLYDIDYRVISYGNIKSLREKCKSDTALYCQMNLVVLDKEAEILNMLSEKTLFEIADYYKCCDKEEHDFLEPILIKLYVSNIENYDYFDIKKINYAFMNAEFGQAIASVYETKKKESLARLDKCLKEYFDLEKSIGVDFQKRLNVEMAYAADSSYNSMIRELTGNQARHYFINSGLDIPADFISRFQVLLFNIACNNLIDYRDCLAMGRKAFCEELFGGKDDVLFPVSFKRPPIQEVSFPYASYSNYCRNPTTQKQDDDETIEAVVDFAMSLTPLGWLDLLPDPSRSSKKKSQKAPTNHRQVFLNDLKKSLRDSKKDYVRTINESINSSLNESQSRFKEMLYEKF